MLGQVCFFIIIKNERNSLIKKLYSMTSNSDFVIIDYNGTDLQLRNVLAELVPSIEAVKTNSVELRATIGDLQSQVDTNMAEMNQRISHLEERMDKLIQANKNLIKYFESMHHEHTARELNFNLRSFMFNRAEKPLGFVASSTTDEN
jgi:hypothetical protein